MTACVTAPTKRANRLVWICYTAILCLATTAHAANITTFGDSITAGNIRRSGGYPPKLSNLLNSNSKPSVIVNTGKWGEKTPEGAVRIDSVLSACPANLILIMEGTNDVWSGIPVETTRLNLQTMISKAKSVGATPVLSTLPPSTKGNSPTLIPQTWNPMIKDLANSNGIRVVDVYDAVVADWRNLTTDGIHPNEAGHQIIANTWYSAIASMISSSGAVYAGVGHGDSARFIATATFGSSASPQVLLLREFRDTCLLSNPFGRWLVRACYNWLPAAANFVSQHEAAKPITRALLYPLVAIAYIFLRLSVPMQITLGILATACCLTFVLFVVHKRRGSAVSGAKK